MIGIIGAMDVEVENLKKIMDNKVKENISGIEFVSGTINNKDVVVAKCGIGKVFASICAQTMILKYKPDYLINTGVAGGLDSTLSVCDVAISAGVVQHDMDTSPLGDPVGLISGINVVEFKADKALVSKAKKAVEKTGINYVCGIIASGDQFVAQKEQKRRIADSFNAVACEMEGGAIGHTAYVNKVPFVVIRAISDGANDEASMDYPTFLEKAAENSTRVTLNLIENI